LNSSHMPYVPMLNKIIVMDGGLATVMKITP